MKNQVINIGQISDRFCKIKVLFCDNNLRDFAQKTGINYHSLSAICNGRRKVGEDVLTKVLDTFPNLSKSWLILGEGEMLTGTPAAPAAQAATTQATTAPTITNNGSGNNNHIGNSDNQSTIPEHVLRLYESLLKEKDETILTLRDTNKTLTAEIEQLRNYVSLTSSKYINVMERMMYTTNETATIVKQCSAKIGFTFSKEIEDEAPM